MYLGLNDTCPWTYRGMYCLYLGYGSHLCSLLEGHFCFRRRHGLSAADMIGYLTYDEPVDRGIVSHYAVYLLVTN